MIDIHCEYCGFDFSYYEDDPLPENCPNCLSPFPEIEIGKKQQGKLELVYQKDGQRLQIEVTDKVMVGRQSCGCEMLASMRHISRNHCQIEYCDGAFYVTDLGSTNGTFLGAAKIDCKTHPRQRLSDGDLLYLGKEPFLVQLTRNKEATQQTSSSAGQVSFSRSSSEPVVVEEEIVKEPQGYECTSCRSYVSPVPGFTCPKCNSYNE